MNPTSPNESTAANRSGRDGLITIFTLAAPRSVAEFGRTPMARFLSNLKLMTDLNRFCLALGLGFAGAVFTANMGWGSSAAFLLSLIVGTVCIISFGGRLRVFYTGVFGAALCVPLLLEWTKSNFGPSGKEVIIHLAISIALPMALAQAVNWYPAMILWILRRFHVDVTSGRELAADEPLWRKYIQQFKQEGEPVGADQPATRSDSKSEDNQKKLI